jgi:hypothetical protein
MSRPPPSRSSISRGLRTTAPIGPANGPIGVRRSSAPSTYLVTLVVSEVGGVWVLRRRPGAVGAATGADEVGDRASDLGRQLDADRVTGAATTCQVAERAAYRRRLAGEDARALRAGHAEKRHSRRDRATQHQVVSGGGAGVGDGDEVRDLRPSCRSSAR